MQFMELVQGTGIDSAGPLLSCSGLAFGPGVLQALGLLALPVRGALCGYGR